MKIQLSLLVKFHFSKVRHKSRILWLFNKMVFVDNIIAKYPSVPNNLAMIVHNNS